MTLLAFPYLSTPIKVKITLVHGITILTKSKLICVWLLLPKINKKDKKAKQGTGKETKLEKTRRSNSDKHVWPAIMLLFSNHSNRISSFPLFTFLSFFSSSSFLIVNLPQRHPNMKMLQTPIKFS